MPLTEGQEKQNTTPESTERTVTDRRRKSLENKSRKVIEKKNEVLKRIEILYVSPDKITANDYNPNRQSEHDFELLLRSMEEDGFTQPILCVREGDKIIIVDGEHRWRAARTLGLSEIPVAIAPMTLTQAKIATLRHNRARGSEDIELTANVLRDLQQLDELDWAKDSLMMDDMELNRLLDDIKPDEAFADEEYSEAWEPARTGDAENAAESADSVTVETSEGEMAVALSEGALKSRRKKEQEIADAKTAEEREKIKQDSKFFRLSLLFANDQAALVKEVLGKQPAETIIEMCMERKTAPNT